MLEDGKPRVIRRGTQTPEQRVFGDDYRVHPITKMPLERGSGATPDDMQARRQHIPYIRQTQGDKAAELMLLALDEYERANNEKWAKWRDDNKSEAAEIAGAAMGKK
jgi:hypothetical protein